jgi:hypothetical protein
MGEGAARVKRFYDLRESGDAPGAPGLFAPHRLARSRELSVCG